MGAGTYLLVVRWNVRALLYDLAFQAGGNKAAGDRSDIGRTYVRSISVSGHLSNAYQVSLNVLGCNAIYDCSWIHPRESSPEFMRHISNYRNELGALRRPSAPVFIYVVGTHSTVQLWHTCPGGSYTSIQSQVK